MIKFLKSHIGEIIICLILGQAFATSNSYLSKTQATINLGRYVSDLKLTYSIKLFLIGLLYSIVFFLLAIAFRKLLVKSTKLNSKFENLYKSKYTLVILTIIILIFWAPILIGMFPGTLINDTWGELSQYYYSTFNDHHPVFDTVVLGGIIIGIAKSTFIQHWQRAFFVFVILQAIATAFSFAYTIYYSKKKLDINNKVLTITLLFYSLIPIFPLAVQTVGKDAMFSWIYVLFIVNFIEIVRTRGDSIKTPKGFLTTFILSMFCCLTKKVGVYILLASFVILLICEFKKLFKFLILLISSFVILMFVLWPIGLKMFKIAKGGEQEKYSLLFQQTTKYVIDHPDDIKESENKVLDKVLYSYEDISERYNPIDADNIKCFGQKGEDKDYIEYLGVWIAQGFRHPVSYIKATCSMLAGNFSTIKYKPLTDMSWHVQLNPLVMNENVTERYGIFEKTSNFISKAYDISHIGNILNYGFWATLAPAFIWITLFKFRKNKDKIKCLIPVVPMLFSIFLGLWLGPVSASYMEAMRYLYPIIYTVPLTLLWCMYTVKLNSEN